MNSHSRPIHFLALMYYRCEASPHTLYFCLYFCNIHYVKQSILSCSSNQFPCVANMFLIISNKVITVANHILVCPQNRGALWDGFETVREEGAVEAVGQRLGVSAIIGHEQRKRHIGMVLFCFHDSARGKTVEVPISPDNKIRHAVFGDMTLDSCKQPFIDALRCIPVTDKEAGLHG